VNQPPQDDGRPWCELRAHDRIIRYRCSGAGRSLIVLGSDGSPFWAVLMAGLDGRFRVILPEAPPEDAELGGWLASLLEGLGTSSIRVIAGDRFQLPAIAIAHEEPDQVSCVVLVSEAAGVVPVSEAAAATARMPVLVVSAQEPAASLADRVRDFLYREGAAATA
jgi:hypothetical protein